MAQIGKIVIAFLLLVGVANEVQAAEREQGILEVQIKDHRDAIGDFDKLIITIDKISVSPKPGMKFWQTSSKPFTVTSEPVDLTKYVGKKTAQVFRAPIEAGAFDAFHLKIRELHQCVKKRKTNAKRRSKTPSVGSNFDYEVRPNTETLLILDLVISDMSDHPPRGYE